MNNSESKENLVITSGRSFFLQVFLISLFLPVLDIISALATQTIVGTTVMYVFFVPLILFVALGMRVVVLNKNNIRYHSYVIFWRTIPLKNIAHINVQVDHVNGTSGPAAVPAMHFIDANSKQIGKIVLSTFNKSDLSRLIQTIKSNNPTIELNNKAEAINIGDSTKIEKEVKDSYFNSIYVLISIVAILFIILGIVFLFK